MENAVRMGIPAQYKWDASHIYPSQEDWEKDYQQIEEWSRELAAFAGTMKEGKETVLKALRLLSLASEHLSRLFSYAETRLNSDNSDSLCQALEGRAISLATRFSAAGAFLSPELLSLPGEVLQEYLQDPDFRDFDVLLKELEHRRPHVLSAEVETILANAGEALGASGNIYDMLTEVDMKLGKVRGEDGKPVELTHAIFGSLRTSPDRAVRKAAFEKMFKTYGSYGSTFAATYSANVKADVFAARTRGYASAREAALYPDNIPLSVYDNLIQAVHDAIPTLNAYSEMRREFLKVPRVHLYDLYVPMVNSLSDKLEYEDSFKLFVKAVEPLGKDYQEVVTKAKDSNWIDVYETPNKTTGAYSNGAAYGVHPYVLLNYRPDVDGLLTLAHEMGHAMHSYYSNGNQPFIKSDYTIFVAEVASTCNEVLTIQSLRKHYQGNREAQAALIGHLLEGFRTTVFRQTMFAEFELKAHEMEESGKPLTKESLNSLYYDLNKLYYGGGCVVDKVIENEWAFIPHFYRSFYVYKYATGFCAAVALANRILTGGEEAVAAYRKFLTLGGSMSPIEELKVAGVDMSTPEPVNAALDWFAELLADFSELMQG